MTWGLPPFLETTPFTIVTQETLQKSEFRKVVRAVQGGAATRGSPWHNPQPEADSSSPSRSFEIDLQGRRRQLPKEWGMVGMTIPSNFCGKKKAAIVAILLHPFRIKTLQRRWKRALLVKLRRMLCGSPQPDTGSPAESKTSFDRRPAPKHFATSRCLCFDSQQWKQFRLRIQVESRSHVYNIVFLEVSALKQAFAKGSTTGQK